MTVPNVGYDYQLHRATPDYTGPIPVCSPHLGFVVLKYLIRVACGGIYLEPE